MDIKRHKTAMDVIMRMRIPISGFFTLLTYIVKWQSFANHFVYKRKALNAQNYILKLQKNELQQFA